MAFWLDRFRRDDEEDIWEELRQMLLNSPSEQEIALKKQQEQAWINSILNKAFPENSNLQTEQTLNTNNSLMSPMGTSNQNTLEGFGQNVLNGPKIKKNKNTFPDLGKVPVFKNESFAPVLDEDRKIYFMNPNQKIVFEDFASSLEKKKPKYDTEETVDNEEIPDEVEDTTSEEPETSEQIEEENSKEESAERAFELKKEPYLRYEDLLPNETDEEREAREARELEAFNKAWDRANGVEEKDADGVLTGGATGIQETPLLQGNIKKTDKNNLTLGEKLLDNYLRNAELIKNNYPISSNMYTDARTDFSKAKTDKSAIVLDNMNSLDSKTIDALKKYGVNINEKGVYYNFNSNVSKSFGKSEELKKAVDKSLENIKHRTFNDEDLNFDATAIDAITNKDKFDRYSSIQHAKLIDAYIDEQGHKRGRFIDNYDFNKRPDTLKNIPNNHGYSLQEKRALENFFTVIDVIIDDEEEKEKLLNKLMKKMQR